MRFRHLTPPVIRDGRLPPLRYEQLVSLMAELTEAKVTGILPGWMHELAPSGTDQEKQSEAVLQLIAALEPHHDYLIQQRRAAQKEEQLLRLDEPSYRRTDV